VKDTIVREDNMGRIIFLIGIIIAGLIIIKLGTDEVKEGSVKENILHTLLDLLLNTGTTHGCGTVVIGVGIMVVGILALIYGWGK
jgi:hypothetical protein